MIEIDAAAKQRLKLPPRVSGATAEGGHMPEFERDYCAFITRAHQECGELAEFDFGGQPTILMSGPPAQEVFFRTPDEIFSQAQAYQVMVPVFGPGVIFDATPERCKTQLKIQVDALRYQNMKQYAGVIAREVEEWIADWGDEGEVEILHAFHELTMHTSTHCLLGEEFRHSMTEEFFSLYKDLQAGVQAIAFADPYMQQPVFAARDAARARLEEIVSELVAKRRAAGDSYGDALETFMTGTYTDGTHLSGTELTGLIIATMFAGHHTSSGAGAETLLEIARHPEYAAELRAEVDDIYRDGDELSHAALREIPLLEKFVDEVLRLHPPLVILMRKVMEDTEYNGHLIEAGKTVAVSIYESHIDPEYFPDPHTFDPHRNEPEQPFAYIPFGGGRHKCAGSAFALLQLKAIFSALLRRYDFELVGPPADYQDVRQNMTIRPSDPCVLRYRRREN